MGSTTMLSYRLPTSQTVPFFAEAKAGKKRKEKEMIRAYVNWSKGEGVITLLPCLNIVVIRGYITMSGYTTEIELSWLFWSVYIMVWRKK